jgi:hypothetical protein
VLVLAGVPPEAVGVSDDGVRGTFVPHGPSTMLADAKASRAGSRLVRRARLTAGPDGVILWIAIVTGPGGGESSSGLRFDILG